MESWLLSDKGYLRRREWRDGKYRVVFQHREVMEAVLGRKLLPNEAVHHRNEIKTDNRPENLEVMSLGAHSAEHNRERGPRTVCKRGHVRNAETVMSDGTCRTCKRERIAQARAEGKPGYR